MAELTDKAPTDFKKWLKSLLDAYKEEQKKSPERSKAIIITKLEEAYLWELDRSFKFLE